MKEVKAAISKLRARAEMYTKLADALMRLGMFADRKPVSRQRTKHPKHRVSRAGRLAISLAQKKRWRRFRKANGAK